MGRKFGNPSMREILVLVITSVSVRRTVRMQYHKKTKNKPKNNANGTFEQVKPVLPVAFVWREVASPTSFKKNKTKF